MVALSQQRTVKYGLLFITLSALCWGMGTVMSKYALGYIPPITLPAAVPLRTWLWAVITGVIQYGCAFWFYLSAIQEVPATQAASFLMLIPVFGVAGASLFLGEQLTFIQFIGGILILAALAGVYRARQPLS